MRCPILSQQTLTTAYNSRLCLVLLYSYAYLLQANDLLKKNLENAKASLDVLVGDLQFLRDQENVTQVHYLFLPRNLLSIILVFVKTVESSWFPMR